jgi:Protein of unknown function (DUF3263)
VPDVDAHTSADLDLPLDIEADAAAIMASVDAPTKVDPAGLCEEHRAILEFERQWWRRPGAKEQAIRDNFEMSPTRYYQALNGLLDLPQALLYDPPLVNRLLRLRASATRARRLR